MRHVMQYNGEIFQVVKRWHDQNGRDGLYMVVIHPASRIEIEVEPDTEGVFRLRGCSDATLAATGVDRNAFESINAAIATACQAIIERRNREHGYWDACDAMDEWTPKDLVGNLE